MRKYICGFYSEPLKWIVAADSEQEAALKFAKIIKEKGLKSEKGKQEFVVFETK